MDYKSNNIVFLTGGSGFVGSNLIKRLVNNGYSEIRAMSRSNQSDSIIRECGGTPIRCSLSDERSLVNAISGCSIVIHCAAKLETNANSIDELFQDNVKATELLYNVSERENVEAFIFISTEGVIMNGKDINDADEDTPIPLDDLGWYNKSKALAERYVLNQDNLRENNNNMRSMVIRLPLVWGKGDNVLKQLVKMANSLQWFWIGGGRNRMSIVHSENAAYGIQKVIENGTHGQVYHLTDGESIKFREFFTERFKRCGVSSWKLNMSIPIWFAWCLVAIMSFVWKLFRLRGLPLLTKTGLIYSSKNFTINDSKARTQLGYRNLKSYQEGMDEFKKI